MLRQTADRVFVKVSPFKKKVNFGCCRLELYSLSSCQISCLWVLLALRWKTRKRLINLFLASPCYTFVRNSCEKTAFSIGSSGCWQRAGLCKVSFIIVLKYWHICQGKLKEYFLFCLGLVLFVSVSNPPHFPIYVWGGIFVTNGFLHFLLQSNVKDSSSKLIELVRPSAGGGETAIFCWEEDRCESRSLHLSISYYIVLI